MKFSLFYHSLVSDWNHGNAHFLRGIVRELMERGHEVCVLEPADGWSRENLLRDHGPEPIAEFQRCYPRLQSYVYLRETLDLARVAADSDLIIVHEWNEPWLVNGLGQLRRQGGDFRLLFHDTHHRIVSDRAWLQRFDLTAYDGVLAFGEVITEAYRKLGWGRSVWTWHEAADTRVFFPQHSSNDDIAGDVVWVGNWGDDERSQELDDFLFRPIRELGLRCNVYGVRYPQDRLQALARQNIHYQGWLANFKVPKVFAQHRATIHVPRRYYRESLPGIPTIRPFEAMACGIPLISAPWEDSENLFSPGSDYLLADSTDAMKKQLKDVLHDQDLARELTQHALATIRKRHSCEHRVEQLLSLLNSDLGLSTEQSPERANHEQGRTHYAQL